MITNYPIKNTKNIVSHKSLDVNSKISVKLITSKPSFLMYPTSLFEIAKEFQWNSRFPIGMGYLYALTYGKCVAKTTTRELQRVLSTNSMDSVYRFFDHLETFQRLIVSESQSVKKENFIKFKRGCKGGTQIEVVLPQEIAYVKPNNRFFPVPKLLFLLPVSIQAKAVLIRLLYLKNKNSDRVITTSSSLAKELKLKRHLIPHYLSELQNYGVLEFERSGKGRRVKTVITIRSPKHWSKRVFREIIQLYGFTHPFLKDWQIDFPECSDRDHKNVPIEAIKNECSDRDNKKVPIGAINRNSNVPIEAIKKPKKTMTPKSSQLHTTSNKVTTITIYNDINNNSGDEKKINKLSNLKDSKRTITKNCSIRTNGKINNSSKRKSFSSERRKRKEIRRKGVKLGKPNQFTGAIGTTKKLSERIDLKELVGIKKILKSNKDKVEELLKRNRIRVEEEVYGALKKVYGEDWKVLAGMYELFDRKAPRFGYNRRANYNYIGLLLSFAFKDSEADFGEFYARFKRVFGLDSLFVHEEAKNADREAKSDLREDVITFFDFKERIRPLLKPSIYRLFIERGIKALENRNGKKILFCKDSAIATYLCKHLKYQIDSVLNCNWEVTSSPYFSKGFPASS